MATIIHLDDLLANTDFEPPCSICYGITSETVPGAQLVMGRTTSGPNMRNQRHYHINCNVGQYRIDGHDKILVGTNEDMEELDVAKGDFGFIAKGEIHGAVGQGENCELMFVYIGVDSKEASGTFFIESPHGDDANEDDVKKEIQRQAQEKRGEHLPLDLIILAHKNPGSSHAKCDDGYTFHKDEQLFMIVKPRVCTMDHTKMDCDHGSSGRNSDVSCE